MSTLLVIEHANQCLHPSTTRLLSAALSLQQPVTALIVGQRCTNIASHVATLTGIDEVLVADKACYQEQFAENVAQLVALVAKQYTHVLLHASHWGRGVLPRVAAHLNCPQVSDVINILSLDTVEHPIYAGNAIEVVRVLTHHKLMTVRSVVFPAVTARQAPCAIVYLQHEFFIEKKTLLTHDEAVTQRPELTQAACVVAAGRGVQTKALFNLVEQLADQLGAAVGATRAAVDAGFITNEYQIGQTGKTIAPLLYLALGISGATQHLAGMRDAKVIVAINKAADAPIMQLAHYALVGDLADLLPELIQSLTKE